MRFALLSVFLLSVGAPSTYAKNVTHTYEVTVKNLTRAQGWGKAIVIVHNADFALFKLDTAASADLTKLAEEGDNSALVASLPDNASVKAFVAADAPVLAGASATFTIQSDETFPLITVAGMLGTTNDTFAAVAAMPLPAAEATFPGSAYDTGTEKNTELCAFIPGMPCAGMGVRDTDGAEGKVQASAGIQGVGDLDPLTYGWTDPAIEVTVKAVD